MNPGETRRLGFTYGLGRIAGISGGDETIAERGGGQMRLFTSISRLKKPFTATAYIKTNQQGEKVTMELPADMSVRAGPGRHPGDSAAQLGRLLGRLLAGDRRGTRRVRAQGHRGQHRHRHRQGACQRRRLVRLVGFTRLAPGDAAKPPGTTRGGRRPDRPSPVQTCEPCHSRPSSTIAPSGRLGRLPGLGRPHLRHRRQHYKPAIIGDRSVPPGRHRRRPGPAGRRHDRPARRHPEHHRLRAADPLHDLRRPGLHRRPGLRHDRRDYPPASMRHVLLIGWMLVGIVIGASIGVYDLLRNAGSKGMGLAIRKVIRGIVGGAIGGGIGGFMQDLIGGAGASRTPSRQSSVAIGMVILGMCIGLLDRRGPGAARRKPGCGSSAASRPAAR